jgi:hypothetical protein
MAKMLAVALAWAATAADGVRSVDVVGQRGRRR